MKLTARKLSIIGTYISMMVLAFGATVSAHVVVRPAEVVTAGFQTFTVGVPNEKDIPTTSIKLLIPDGLRHVSPTQKAGWQIATAKQGTGEETVITSITWSGGAVNPGLRDDFTFSAQVPETATELQWKAYQTYADGTVVSWDQAGDGGHGEAAGNTGPFSVTTVVAESTQDTSAKNANQTAADAKKAASRSLYVAAAGVVVGLMGVFLATRKK